MKSKYIDPTAIIQVIGCTFNNPHLLDKTDKYRITDEDFPDEFHKILYGSIFKLYELGADNINLATIKDFLKDRPKSNAVYENQKGEEWLTKASMIASLETFDYYYSRLKKMSLLRAYETYGVDVSDIYDPDNILDAQKKELQESQLDNSSLEEIANKIDLKISKIREEYVDEIYGECHQAGEGINELIDRLKLAPEAGVPLYGPYINAVTRGARLRKFYLRSAPTGTGKSRSMIADACYIACDRIYDSRFGWLQNGTKEPTLYITTEQDLEEIQTMMLAFIAEVDEEHILDGRKYIGDEEERVRRAAQILSESPLYIEVLPDFSLQDVEDVIKKNIREHDVLYVLFDYIQTSIKILAEITNRTGGVKLREDNILFMLSAKLKDIANEYGVFVLSSTQLNASWKTDEIPDQNLLRGAKSIADRADYGSIILPVSQEDLDSLETLISTNGFEKPGLKISVYKNRRGKFKGIYLWCRSKLECCRIEPMFCTTYNYDVIDIADVKIMTEPEQLNF